MLNYRKILIKMVLKQSVSLTFNMLALSAEIIKNTMNKSFKPYG